MVVVGVDVHKRTHTCVAIDEAGRKLGEKTVTAIPSGFQAAVAWANEIAGGSVKWAVEDSRSLAAGLERDLLATGAEVVRIPPRLTARQRSSGRAVGKSDPIDALAVARVALREPDLPRATVHEQAREMKLLVDYRECLVNRRTALINSLRSRVHEIDAEYGADGNVLTRIKTQHALLAWLDTRTGLLAELARAEVEDVTDLTERINEITTRIKDLIVKRAPSLLKLPGCAELTAAKIYGETSGIDRFVTEAKYAAFAGIAPIPVWSGNSAGRVRLSRLGNRQLNTAIWRIAFTQSRIPGPGKRYYEKKRSEGRTRWDCPDFGVTGIW